MIEMILLRPYWLLALIPLGGLALWFWKSRPEGPWAKLISPQMLATLAEIGWLRQGEGRASRLWLPLAGLSLIMGLVGPATPRQGMAEYRRLDPLLLVLDLSPSVVASKQGLAALQTSAMRFLNAAEGRPVGVMAYAADAYLLSAPTTDSMSLEGTIAVLSDQTMPVAGSRPDIALSMARDLFAVKEDGGPGIGGADIVVISDGVGAKERAIEEARRLQDEGARIWAVQVPTVAEGAPPAQPQALADLAKAGGGEAYPEAEVPALIQEINSKARIRLARDPQSGEAMQDFGPWLLALAMALLLPLYRRRNA